MSDRSEKIVTLAREILARPEPESDHGGQYSLKTVALAAMLSAAGASGATVLALDYARPLNRYEKIELIALIRYAADTQHIEKDSIRDAFFDQFGIVSLDDLSNAQMNEARDYLQKRIKQNASF
ncbi:MAG: hypothetical protein WDO70_11920 [Alphaproteobacteria bacterium]